MVSLALSLPRNTQQLDIEKMHYTCIRKVLGSDIYLTIGYPGVFHGFLEFLLEITGIAGLPPSFI
jgi:hypothetical protein